MPHLTRQAHHKPPPSSRECFVHGVLRLAEKWNARLIDGYPPAVIPPTPLTIPKYDLTHLRNLPILCVAESLGLQLRRTGSKTWNVKDRDDPLGYTSLTIFEKTNTWKRWSGKTSGGVSQGSTIDLVMHARDCSFKEALEFLSSRFP